MSKAFDTVRHSSLAVKLADSPISDHCYNWLVDYLQYRSHNTKFNNEISTCQTINSSVVQGSALGPMLFTINSTDCIAIVDGNFMFKYADDSYLLVPSINTGTIPQEIQNLSLWASNNNLKLNHNKTHELILYNKYSKNLILPPADPNLQRVNSLQVLGVIVDCNLTFASHVNGTLASCSQTLYALKNCTIEDFLVKIFSM